MPKSEVIRPADWAAITATIGSRVRSRREELGLRQEQLAERTGMSRNQIQNIEKSRGNSTVTSNPKLDALWALATALEIELSDLLSNTAIPAQK